MLIIYESELPVRYNILYNIVSKKSVTKGKVLTFIFLYFTVFFQYVTCCKAFLLMKYHVPFNTS